MDHVLWEGLYADRVRTNWCFGTKEKTIAVEPLNGWRGVLKAVSSSTSPSMVNALRFALVMTRKQERQTGVVIELDRQVNGCCRGWFTWREEGDEGFTWREEGGCHIPLPLGKQSFFLEADGEHGGYGIADWINHGTTGDCLYHDPMLILNSSRQNWRSEWQCSSQQQNKHFYSRFYHMLCTPEVEKAVVSGMEGTRNFG